MDLRYDWERAVCGARWDHNDAVTLERPLKLNSGDIVNFIWESNHNVDPVASKEDYDSCVVGNHHPEAGPLAWTAPKEEGITYVICGVGNHCTDGNQKLAITVSHSC